MISLGVVSAAVGFLVGVVTLANPLFKLHSRIDLMAYRLELLEKRVQGYHEEIHKHYGD